MHFLVHKWALRLCKIDMGEQGSGLLLSQLFWFVSENKGRLDRKRRHSVAFYSPAHSPVVGVPCLRTWGLISFLVIPNVLSPSLISSLRSHLQPPALYLYVDAVKLPLPSLLWSFSLTSPCTPKDSSFPSLVRVRDWCHDARITGHLLYVPFLRVTSQWWENTDWIVIPPAQYSRIHSRLTISATPTLIQTIAIQPQGLT